MNGKNDLTEKRNESESSYAKNESKLISDEDLSTLSQWDKLMLRFHALPKSKRGIYLGAATLILVLICVGFIRKLSPPPHHASSIDEPVPPYAVPAAEPAVEQGVDIPEGDEWLYEGYEEYPTDFEDYEDWSYEEAWEEGRNGAMVQRTWSGKYYYVVEANGTEWYYIYDGNDRFFLREGYLEDVSSYLGNWEPVPGGAYWQKVMPVCFSETIPGTVYAIHMGFRMDTSRDTSHLRFNVYGTSASNNKAGLKYIGSFNYDPFDLWNGFYSVTLDGNGEGIEIENLEKLYIIPQEDDVYDDLNTIAVEISLIEVTSLDYEY